MLDVDRNLALPEYSSDTLCLTFRDQESGGELMYLLIPLILAYFDLFPAIWMLRKC